MFDRQEIEREKRKFLWGTRKEIKKRVFSDLLFHLIKVSHWNYEGAYSLEKLGDQNIIGNKISGCKNQVTWRAKYYKAILVMFLDSLWFDICIIHDS